MMSSSSKSVVLPKLAGWLVFGLCLSIFLVVTMMPMAEQPKAQSTAQQAKQFLRRFRSEPTVRDVHKAAVRYALVTQGRITSLFSRARFAGWLPEFRFRYNRNIDDDRTTVFPTSTTPILTSQATDLDHRFEFRATWDLDKLIFNQEELRVYRELKKLIELRVDVMKEVTKLYYERRRLQVDLVLRPPRTLLERVRRMLRLQELSADLDALTGGYFSRRLGAIGKNPYK